MRVTISHCLLFYVAVSQEGRGVKREREGDSDRERGREREREREGDSGRERGERC